MNIHKDNFMLAKHSMPYAYLVLEASVSQYFFGFYLLSQ